MFKLELLELTNKYKKGHPDEKQEIEKSIIKLIKDNKNEFEKFVASEEFDPHTQNLLQRCQKDSEKEEEEKIESTDNTNDFIIIRRKYEKWLNFYTENNKIPERNCEKIIEELIGFYIVDKYEVLKEILKINDSKEYEAFKNMLNNYLRKYFINQVKTYYESENFKSLGFLKKRNKKKQILSLLDNIGSYKFDKKKIEEVLK